MTVKLEVTLCSVGFHQWVYVTAYDRRCDCCKRIERWDGVRWVEVEPQT